MKKMNRKTHELIRSILVSQWRKNNLRYIPSEYRYDGRGHSPLRVCEVESPPGRWVECPRELDRVPFPLARRAYLKAKRVKLSGRKLKNGLQVGDYTIHAVTQHHISIGCQSFTWKELARIFEDKKFTSDHARARA